MKQADGRLQQHGERTKCSFVVALHTGNFINCAFCYADACRPSQPPSPLTAFLLPLSSTESKTSLSLSLSLFFSLSLFGSCVRESLKDYLLSLSRICHLQSDESSSSLRLDAETFAGFVWQREISLSRPNFDWRRSDASSIIDGRSYYSLISARHLLSKIRKRHLESNIFVLTTTSNFNGRKSLSLSLSLYA